MPDADQPVALGPDHDRGLLSADCPPVQRRQVVGCDLERIEEIVQVLDVAYRPQAAHGRADRLAQDRRLPNSRVGQPQLAVLGLQTFEDEVDVAEAAHVLADDEDPRVAREVGVEVAEQHHPAVDGG